MMITRRSFIRFLATSVCALSSGILSARDNNAQPNRKHEDVSLPLSPPDLNGVMLPPGYRSRIIAVSGETPLTGSSYRWHHAPDGGACFATEDGGWIYVSNSEAGHGLGGAGALRFDATGKVIKAYPILENTSHNCAGGATPWSTWLSCEEHENGIVWECDPYGEWKPAPLPALGTFAHEAVTVDTLHNHLYLTEDRPDGCLYRFVPERLDIQGNPDLSRGSLQVAVIDPVRSMVNWIELTDPSAALQPTRFQVHSATSFNGGEGIVFFQGIVSFATKGDNRIWSYNTHTRKISIRYDAKTHPYPILSGVDNITLSPHGNLVVGEDGGDLQLVLVDTNNMLSPLIQLVGHDASEVTGPAFSPDGKYLYFSSQRGTNGHSGGGMTFEVTGPFDC